MNIHLLKPTWYYRCFLAAVGFGMILSGPAQAQVTFSEVGASAGVAGDTYSAVNFHSLGVNWIDYDNDGDPDLFLVNGVNRSAHLYRNNGNGTFTDVSSTVLPALPNVDMGGSRFADYDNDGDTDIFIYTDNDGVTFTQPDYDGAFLLEKPNEPSGPPDILLQNQGPPNFNFIDAAVAAGVNDLPSSSLGPLTGFRSMTAGWIDYNKDGCLDLYVGHWVLNTYSLDDGTIPGGGIGNRGRFYENNCDGTFTDVTMASGVNPNPESTATSDSYRPALGFIGADLDNDYWPDMYVVNAHDPAPYYWDFIFQNKADGTGFNEVSGLVPAGSSVNPCPNPGIGDDSGSGMGIDVSDIDLDGDWDIYLSDIFDTTNDCLPFGNVLYLNRLSDTGTFGFSENGAPAAGVSADFSWGVNFFDADNDGYEDLYVATNPDRNKFFYLNNRNGTFSDIATAAGINTASMNSRGSATADYDGDGDLDLAVINQNAGLQLFRNDTPSGSLGGFLKITLVPGSGTNKSAINAVVKVRAGSLRMMRQVKGGSSGHSEDDLNIHFGLGPAAEINSIEIHWPDAAGTVERLCGVSPNQKLTLTQGTIGAPVCPPPTDSSAPEAPPNIQVGLLSATEASVTWGTAFDDVDVTGYRVYRDGSFLASATGLSHTDSGLSFGKTYCYTVTAVDGTANESVSSGEACATTLDVNPPSAPGNLRAGVLTADSVELLWDTATDDVGVVSYKVFRGGTEVGHPTGLDYTDTGLNAGTSYNYTVYAVDGVGNISLTGALLTVSTAAASGGGGGGGACFIATAAFGSPMAPQVELLREFRDRYLKPYEWGRRFIETYYAYSPPIADFIAGHQGMRAGVRLVLWPVVGSAWFVVKAPLAAKWGAVFGLMCIVIYATYPRRRSR